MQPSNVSPQPEKPALRLYYALAEQLKNRHLEPTAAATSARQIATRYPSLSAISRLLREAEEQYWYAPRHSWVLAHLAHAATQCLTEPLAPATGVSHDPDSALLLADSSFILGLALNTLGRFAEALPLLQVAAEDFLAHDKLAQAVRANSEVAMASLYMANFEFAGTVLSRTRSYLDEPLAQAYCDRAEGLLHLMQSRYDKATVLLRQAGDTFFAASWEGLAALAWCHLAEVLRYVDTEEALKWLERARRIPIPSDWLLHTARCDHILGLIYHEQNRYAESLSLYRNSLATFTQERADFLSACCALDMGNAHYRLNQYQEAQLFYDQAQTSFIAQTLSSYVAICDMNIALVYYKTNRYAKALTVYQRVAKEALAEGRDLRAARCHTNIGLCYDKLGRYDRALIWHHRARHAFLEAGSEIYTAHCQENLAGTYRLLGRYEQAMTHYQQAHEIFVKNKLTTLIADCDMRMADLYLALEHTKAKACLEDAHGVYREAGMEVHQALCDRLLAQVALAMEDYDQALLLLKHAREVFTSQEMLVEMALCNLIEGEMKLAVAQIEPAEEQFEQARAVLIPGFPDQAWRIEEGLAQCALAGGKPQIALEHYTKATHFVNQARETLSTERLSSSFFARREHVFQAAIQLALQQNAYEQALALVEACKARTLLTQYRSRRQPPSDDPFLTRLIEREAALRQQLEKLRSQFTSWQRHDDPLPATRGNQAIGLEELAALSHAYEEVVDQLRLMGTLPPNELGSPFSLAAFREKAAKELPKRWACLAYFLVEDQLLIFSLDAEKLEVHPIPLTSSDKQILSQCVSREQERRELIYRGTIRGFPVPGNPGILYRQHLGRLLFPPTLLANMPDVLLLVPHAILHGLPFHALFVGESLLLEKVPVFYAPSLQVLQTLWEQGADTAKRDDRQVAPIVGSNALLCGLESFSERAAPLPHARREIEGVANTVGGQAKVLYGAEATVASLKELNKSAELATFDLVHFATHAVTESVAPMLSRVLLADDDLTVLDILDLNLAARLVSLSSCQAAVGEANPGDEMMTLARAFFYAGAQTVLASLWPVEDEATAVLMQYFYQRLQTGETISQALRQTQLAMHHVGYSAYQWAPFIAIGCP